MVSSLVIPAGYLRINSFGASVSTAIISDPGLPSAGQFAFAKEPGTYSKPAGIITLAKSLVPVTAAGLPKISFIVDLSKIVNEAPQPSIGFGTSNSGKAL